MADETLDIGIELELRALRTELAKMDGIADKEARKLVGVLTKQFKKAEKAAERSAKKTSQAWQKGIDGAGKAGKAFGGQFGGAVTILEDFSDGLGAIGNVAGPVGSIVAATGLLFAGAGFSVIAAGSAVRDFAADTVEAQSRLEELGLAKASDEVDALERSMLVLDATMDNTKVTLAESSGLWRDFLLVLSGGADVVGNIAQAGEGVGGSWARGVADAGIASSLLLEVWDMLLEQGEGLEEQIGDLVTAVDFDWQGPIDTTGTLAEKQRVLAEESREAEKAARDLAATQRKQAAEASRAAAEATREYTAAVRANASELNAHLKLEKDVARARGDANQELARIIAESQADELTEEERIAEAHRERIANINEAASIASDTGASLQARKESELRMERDLIALEQDRLSALEATAAVAVETEEVVVGFFGRMAQAQQDFIDAPIEEKLATIGTAASATFAPIADILSMLHDQTIANAEAEVTQREENLEHWRQGELEQIDAMVERGELSEKQAILERRQVAAQAKAKKAANKSVDDAAREAAADAFKANKRLQVGQATIESFRAGVSLIPAFAFLGPGAPVAAAGVAATGLAAAVAGINAQDAPSFERGGMVADMMRTSLGQGTTPDHALIAAQPTEGVLTARGVGAVGGPEGVRQANNGRSSSGAINLFVDGRLVASAAAPHLADAFLQPTPGSYAAGVRPLYK